MDGAGDDVAHEGCWCAIMNLDVGDGTGEAGIAIEDDDAIAATASDQLICAGVGRAVLFSFYRTFARAFDEDFDRAADEVGVVFGTDCVLQIEHFVITAFFDLVLDVIRIVVGGFGAGSFGVFEDEAVFEAELADGVHRFLMSFFGFATEADDEVAGDGTVGNDFADAVHHVAVFADGVAPLHFFEDFIATVLQRDVQIMSDFRQIANRVEQVVCHVFGVIGDKFDSLNAFGFMK